MSMAAGLAIGLACAETNKDKDNQIEKLEKRIIVLVTANRRYKYLVKRYRKVIDKLTDLD